MRVKDLKKTILITKNCIYSLLIVAATSAVDWKLSYFVIPAFVLSEIDILRTLRVIIQNQAYRERVFLIFNFGVRSNTYT